ncbi:1-deoxy-D-xylulose-5-phosphate synthase [Longirhabdus pacifica]|uniref:1-deoxy-D-xylulose-5-phosphate synthase n=1 Tax=Longirhabdus pacifica TaxID=2305227 RepID=UPI0010092845|nr:1-deoxy-D-xylulose-5-phosphate synthase [Longirhabdus pacifica]
MLLDNIHCPDDLKSLNVEQLEQLAAEIRSFLVEQLSVTGGHLASNLGVVELTIAMHYMFDSPRSKFIFDVGHQSYVHKILTGRKDRFQTLRKYNGLCGFVKRTESEHDVWEAGHSSTSLSAAMGMAMARDLKKEDHAVVAMIGDGALTGGMALEALNHIGHEQRKMIVLLNDNEMSIAPNVGAIHKYLEKIRADKHYLKAKEDAQYLLKKIPAIGGKLAKSAEKLKDSLKYLILSGVWFEELGFTYMGPIDGHNFDEINDAFKQASNINGPVLIHAVTLKGKGYSPAEADSHKWHGISPYKIESGKVIQSVNKKPPTYTEVFGNTLMEFAKHDDRVLAITPAMPGGSGLLKFAEEFPERMIDVGIAEQHAATFSAALALEGMKPVFAVYSTFLQRAYDQVVHDICRHNANVIMAIDRAGFVGADGETHHGVYDISYLRHIPNIVFMMPKNENELRHMMKTAIEYDDGPIAIRYPRMNGLGVPLDDYEQLQSIPIGEWEVVQEGNELAILAIGPMVQLAEQASGELIKQGIRVKIINARYIKPLDEKMLLQLAKDKMSILTLEEAAVAGGFGSAVLEFFANENITSLNVKNMGISDCFVQHGSISEQRNEVDLTVNHVVNQIKMMFPLKQKQA